MIGTAFWYLHTDQWRYDQYTADVLASPLAQGEFAGQHTADLLAQSARLGWMPSLPDVRPQPARPRRRGAAAEPDDPARTWSTELRGGRLRFACEDPDAPENWPRVLTVWRANLLGSSAKGNEYFLRHLLGTDSSLRAAEAPPRRGRRT